MNPVQVAPEQRKVKAGFAREDLFVVRARAVHDGDRADGRRGAAGHHVPGARRRLPGRRPPAHPAGPEADRAAGRVPLQPRGDLRAGQARRRRAPRLRHEPARDHRLDAAEVGLGHAGRAGSEEVDRLPARRSTRRTTSTASRYPDKKFRFKPDWQNVPAPRANGFAHRPRHAGPARPLGRDREGGRRASLPARHQPGARIPQLLVQRDADQPRQARAAARQGASRRPGEARRRRRRARAHGQRARRDRARGRGLPRRAARRRHRREHRPQRPVRGRRGHQHADQRLPGRALRRRRLPRQPRVDQERRRRRRCVRRATRLRDGSYASADRVDDRVRRRGAAGPAGDPGRASVQQDDPSWALQNIDRAPSATGFDACAAATAAELEDPPITIEQARVVRDRGTAARRLRAGAASMPTAGACCR